MDGVKKQSNSLVDQLRAAITSSGMSLYSLAQATGVDRGILGRFVRGERTMTVANAAKVTSYLRLELRSIEGGE